MTMHLFWVQNRPFSPNKFFLEIYYYHSNLPISPFHCAKLKKSSSSRSRVMRMLQLLGSKWPISPNHNFFRNLFMSLVCFIHAYLHTKNLKVKYLSISELLMIKQYWNFIGREPFFSLNWELDFSQTCSFRKILMNHKNFDFTHIKQQTKIMTWFS